MKGYITDIDGQRHRIELDDGGVTVRLDGAAVDVSPAWLGHAGRDLLVVLNGRSYDIRIEEENEHLVLTHAGWRYHCQVLDERMADIKRRAGMADRPVGRAVVKSPMPGLVVKLLVESGATVQKGERLLILEAMKMENDVKAPCAGTVTQIRVNAGEAVDAGRELVVIEP
ncbi:MAG: biotin/lipoyl-containing protein [Candidatus Zixiibacteriota bacterium]